MRRDTTVGEPELSANAREVLAARYLEKGPDGRPAETPADLFHRVAEAVAEAERLHGASEAAAREVADAFYGLMASRRFMPNSPTLMNAGRPLGMLSACFVLPVPDSMHGIFTTLHHAALIQKAGGGTGFDFSRLRPRGDRIATSGGSTSGPVSFMKVYSEATGAITQGAFRRGANMGMLRVDHPDVLEFIRAKEDLRVLTNFNVSVSLTDEFMEAATTAPGTPHRVANPRDGTRRPLVDAEGHGWTVGEVFDLIVQKAWSTAEPGVVFIDRVNRDNPTPALGPIEATNPCGEQPLLPYEACNLGSINLERFVAVGDGPPRLDEEGLVGAVRLATRFLDDVIDVNRYPVPEIEAVCKGNRKVGLGLMGFADALFRMGLAYDSPEAVAFGGRAMRVLDEASHLMSEDLARERGVFPNWAGSLWEARGRRLRNATTSTVAPTGTISIIAGCSGGIEPVFGLAFHRNVLDGRRLVETNPVFHEAAEAGGWGSEGLSERLVREGGLRAVEGIPEEARRVFVTAHDIAPEAHVRMQAAFQAHCDASISKTTNFPRHATPEDVRSTYLAAWRAGLKGVTVYRDGCRTDQPMALAPAPGESGRAAVGPVRLPEIMPALRIRQLTPFGNMHVKVTVDPRAGVEREVFAQLGKGGDIANSDLEAICRLLSLFLRSGGSLEVAMDQLAGIGSSLVIPSRHGRVTSLADGLAKALGRYRAARERHGLRAILLGEADLASEAPEPPRAAGEPVESHWKLRCPECSEVLAFEEGCVTCRACGFSLC